MWMIINIPRWQQYWPLDSPVNKEFFAYLVFAKSLLALPEIIFYKTPHRLQPRSNAMCRRGSPQNYRKQTSQIVTGKSNFMWVSRPLHRLATNFPMSTVSSSSSSVPLLQGLDTAMSSHAPPAWGWFCWHDAIFLREGDSNGRMPTLTEHVEVFFWSSKQTSTTQNSKNNDI